METARAGPLLAIPVHRPLHHPLMPRFHVITFGCQMNRHDSDRLAETLTAAGHTEADSVEGADIVVLNTCSVREKAEQKLRSEVGRLAPRSHGESAGRGAERMIVVAGCVAQQEGQRLLKTLPQIDLLIGPDNIGELPELLSHAQAGRQKQVRAEFDLVAPEFLQARPQGEAPPSTFVTVMKGCDERCTYCVVPYTRGPERYRPSQEILSEIERLVSMGTREVTLLGQTVNSYRDPTGLLPKRAFGQGPSLSRLRHDEEESEFASLLYSIAEKIPGLARLRYTSPHPRHLTEGLIRAHAELPIMARHVHLPVQSGSDRVLKRMIRRYTVAEYISGVERLKSRVSDLTLSTDVIVGFPGETESDFEATKQLMKAVGFVGVFGFKYSPRPHTPALNLENDVPEEVKARRLSELFLEVEPARRAHLESLLGTRQQVLVEQKDERGAYSGRSQRNDIVHFFANRNLVGSLCEVEISRVFKNSVAGELVLPDLRAPWRDRKPLESRSLPLI